MHARNTVVSTAIALLIAFVLTSNAHAGPTGACCFNSGFCGVVSEAQCTGVGGTYQGDGTTCIASPCLGACCLLDGTCSDLDGAGCAAINGLYQGLGTTCAADGCPGACCLADASCVGNESPASCAGLGGTYQGLDSVCAGAVCTGACCFEDGSCLTDSASDCAAAGANYQGNGTTCAGVNCPSLVDTEAYTFALSPGSTTTSLTQFDDLGGTRILQKVTLQIDATIRAEVILTNLSADLPIDDTSVSYDASLTASTALAPPIPPIVLLFNEVIDCGPGVILNQNDSCDFGGLISFTGGEMAMYTAPGDDLSAFIGIGDFDVVIDAEGTFVFNKGIPFSLSVPLHEVLGSATVIYEYIVPGACCLPNGACIDVDRLADCAAQNGTYQGAGTSCATAPCGGACCLTNGACIELPSSSACALSGGVFQGLGTTCATVTCPGACCLQDGTCLDGQSAADCTAQGGEYQGLDSTCATIVCPGACCLQDGTCLDGQSLTQCNLQGGTYQGLDTTCATITCPGACCLQDGTCIDTVLADCTAQGGEFQGLGTTCATTVCPGACCLQDGTCIDTDLADCTAQGGEFQGLNTTCATVTCPGACCLQDGTCLDGQSLTQCNLQGGTYQGLDTTCATITCPGACCLQDGTCIDTVLADCTAQGGEFQGLGSTCATTVCPGACCLQDGTCIDTDLADCTAQGGEFQGLNTTCATVTCPGACCLQDGSCLDGQSLTQCNLQGGTYQGLNTTCATITCPGACCLQDGTCIDTVLADCTAQGGEFQGLGTTCATVTCPGACCLQNGQCIDNQTLADCTAQGGEFQGLNTFCFAVVCPGACCLPSGVCLDGQSLTQCSNQAGVYQGLNSTCATVTCPGACCLPDGTCQVEDDLTACELLGGDYQGLGTTCAGVVCGGACCLPDQSCIFTSSASCLAQGGSFQGLGTTCAGVTCDDLKRGCGNDKGSLIIWSKVEIRWDAAGFLLQDTFIELSNDYPGDVRFQMYFINGDPPLPAVTDAAGNIIEREHPGWNWVDNAITLTANQPTWWSAVNGNQGNIPPLPTEPLLSPFGVLDPGLPPGRPDPAGGTDRVLRGYIIGWAVDADGNEIRWNHFSGGATLLDYGGGAGWAYSACSFPVVDGTVANGGVLPSQGVLNLDGAEYAFGPDQILLDFQATGSTAWSAGNALVLSDTDLTLHPLNADLRQETDGPVTTKASFDVWNENEVKFSGAHRCITCWDQTLLSDYSALDHFSRINLQTDGGKARINGLMSQNCDLDFDLGDGLPLGADPRDIVSTDASMIGLAAKYFTITAAGGPPLRARSGNNLYGLGFEAAAIQYDPVGTPPESTGGGASPGPATSRGTDATGPAK